ncbi:MAG: GNAT family N-acetyltransferase [Acidimicrobiales bacterium]
MPQDVPWLLERPPARIVLPLVTLVRASLGDARALAEAAGESLEHLRPWMPWAQVAPTTESMAVFLREAVFDWDSGQAFQYVMCQPGSGVVLGGCGLHARLGPGVLEIGYWVHVSHVGRGIATAAAGGLTAAALGLAAVDRVEIRCDAANLRSAAIPRRLGYRLARIEIRAPGTPGETDEHMVWARDRLDDGSTREEAGGEPRGQEGGADLSR